MRILILGSGGREAAIYRKLEESPEISQLFALPGNAGMKNSLPGNVERLPEIAKVALENKIDLIVVGPEVPLCNGIVDYFEKHHSNIKVFGPNREAAQLEGSKIFSQKFMQEYDIPVATGTECNDLETALQAIEKHALPIVIKADGLAAGKGVSIHQDRESAISRIQEIFTDKLFGDAGNRVLLQKFLTGTEASLFAICNGEDGLILPTARDYKRAFDNNEGPNTGGMGSYSPGNHLSDAHIGFARKKIIQPVLDRFKYRGILYVGLMVHSEKANDLSVIEFNCRLGDPETQCVMPRLEGDLLPYLLWSTGENKLVTKVREDGFDRLPVKPGVTLNTVIAARGYPEKYAKGLAICLPDKNTEGVHIIHAGTKFNETGEIVSNGGRILNVVAQAKTRTEAKSKVYQEIEKLTANMNFNEFIYRTDIGDE
ncbi:MAG: phosphoribosylamine--glycine ligase [Leptospiraceae bacterium]|nr:phosphoribosylamine--glycine ligase [Leptospiraceae bacterium]